MIITYCLIALIFALLLLEAFFTRAGIYNIRMKIHVNGTRGKSTITKYITSALRGADIRSIGKVTGEVPALIQPDGRTVPIKRRGPARISEQFSIIRKASKARAEALVLECMSIAPELQRTESRYFKPDIYVLSNIRDDHREKAGQNAEQRIESYCQAIPANSILVSNDHENIDAIRAEAIRKHCRLVIPEKIDKKLIANLPYGVFTSNIELAVEVAVLAGINREKAINSILDGLPKDESLIILPRAEDSDLIFLNAFPVNDPDSATDFFNHWSEGLDIHDNIVFIFNTRSDRPLRTDQFSEWIKGKSNLCKLVYITGDQRERAYRLLRGLSPEVEIRKLRSKEIRGILNTIENEFRDLKLIMGIGNIKGDGYRIINEFSMVS